MFDGLLFFLYTWNLMAEHDREVEETEGCQIRSSLIGSELLQVHWNHKYMNFGILVHWTDKLSMIIDALIKDRVILGLEKGKKSQNLVRPDPSSRAFLTWQIRALLPPWSNMLTCHGL